MMRTCKQCAAPFEDPRTTGRPRELCGAECRRLAARRRQREYMDRLMSARNQFDRLQAA